MMLVYGVILTAYLLFLNLGSLRIPFTKRGMLSRINFASFFEITLVSIFVRISLENASLTVTPVGHSFFDFSLHLGYNL